MNFVLYTVSMARFVYVYNDGKAGVCSFRNTLHFEAQKKRYWLGVNERQLG
jgi:hypothetical protein